MVCSIGSAKMTALPRLLDAGTVSHSVTENIRTPKLAAQNIRREIQEADEANLLDEEDMHIFGLRPMTDLLDLVCCNLCKKPIRASHYASHAELCKYLIAIEGISPELDGPAVNKKPPRKERKKSAQTKKGSSVREFRKCDGVASANITASESHAEDKILMNPCAEDQLNMQLNSTPTIYGSGVNPCDMNCSEDATKGSPKPLKRMAAENPSNLGTKNLCKIAAEVHPYVPAPLATKIYYSERNHLRRAISYMFFGEPNKEVSNVELLQANADPTQTSAPSNFYHEQSANQQASRGNINLHVAQTPDQILAASSEVKSGGLVQSGNTASQLPMNNALGSNYSSNAYSFSDKAGISIGTLQQGNGNLPVLKGGLLPW